MDLDLIQIRADLKAKTQEEQEAVLRQAGMDENQIKNYLLNFNRPPAMPKAKKEEPFTQSGEWRNLLNRFQTAMQNTKNNPPIPEVELYTPFERDILHNRHLQGCSTDLDYASFRNEKMKHNQVTNWFLNEFMPSGCRVALLMGCTGNGKTWGGLAYLNSVADFEIKSNLVQGTNAIFIDAYKISEMLQNRRKHDEQLEKIRRVRYLMIDELGGEPSSQSFAGAEFKSFFDNLFSDRHKNQKLHTVLTTNYTENQVIETYGQRFLSRINDVGLYIESTDPDYRVKP